MNPANAVVDRPIRLRNGQPVAAVIPMEKKPPAPEVKPGISQAEFDRRCLEFFVRSVTPSDDTPFVSHQTVKRIIHTVADHYGIPLTDFLAERRTRKIVRPRQIAMWLAKTLTTRSLPYIGERFNGRDHTTVLHAVWKIDALRAADPELQAQLDAFIERLAPNKTTAA